MNAEWVREHCLSFRHATEQVTWGSDLTFRIRSKIFAVMVLDVAPVWLSFKCSPEDFAELTERPRIIPAPYLARAQWVALETKDALPARELSSFLRKSYDLVFAKLPARTRASLASQTARAEPHPHASRTPSRQKAVAKTGTPGRRVKKPR